MKNILILILILLGNISFSQNSNYSSYQINNSISDPISVVSDIVFLNPSTGYVVAGYRQTGIPDICKLYKTTNYGQNWSKIYSINLSLGSGEISFSINGNVGYIMVQHEQTILYKTTDAGNSFSTISTNISDPSYKNVLSVGANNHLYRLVKGRNKVCELDHPIIPYITYFYTYSFATNIILNHIEVSKISNTIYVCGKKDNGNPFLAKSTDNGHNFSIIKDGSDNPNGIGPLYHMSIYYEGNNEVLKISGYNQMAEYRNSFIVTNSSWGTNVYRKISFGDSNNGFYIEDNFTNDNPPTQLSLPSIWKTTNGGTNWNKDFEGNHSFSFTNRFCTFGNITYFLETSANYLSPALFHSRNLSKVLATYHDNISSLGGFKINNDPYSTYNTYNIRGGTYPLWTEPVLNQGLRGEKIFYRWSFNNMSNSISNYDLFYDGELAAYYKTKLKADNHWAINNAAGSKSVRDKNGNVNTIHESIGGIFFTKSTNNGADFKTEEIVNDNVNNYNLFSVNNNTNPYLSEIKKDASLVPNLSPESNMIAVWENRNGNTITINTATREQTIDLQNHYWKRDIDGNIINIVSSDPTFYSHPKVFSQVTAIVNGYYYQMKIITYLESGTNENILKAKVQYKTASNTIETVYSIAAGDFRDFACVSEIYKDPFHGFKLHYSYKKGNQVFYKNVKIWCNYTIIDKVFADEENVSSSDFYYQKSNPDITLRNGAPAISYTGRYQENRSIEWDNGGSGPSTLSTTYYPVVVKYKKYGVMGWTKIVYNSNGFGTQENANVEGSKDTSAYIVNYSKNGTLFNQFVQIDGRRGYSCSPGAFNGSDAKLVRGGYKGQFGSGSNPLLLKLNFQDTILHSPFSILPTAIETDGFSNLDGVIEKDNTLYSLTLGPIVASNTTYGFDDETPPQTVQNPVEFNETMVSAVFSLSNYDTLILGANGKYTASFTQVINPLKYHVNLVNASSGQIHRELFRDTIKTEDSIGIEFLRGYVINNIDKGTDQFYIQMIVDTVDAGDGDYNMAGVYADNTPPQGDAPVNYKTKVFFENGSNSLTSGNQIPKDYSLSQNYPNPFNPSTTIKYSLPKDGFVSLKIYDITGREVKSLAGEVKKAGYYSVTFNASSLASGVYFYRIQSNDYVMTKRMVLIK
ncbi:MAG: T9SS type A sorting domain-containing protein [Ignavibacteria bacterium]